MRKFIRSRLLVGSRGMSGLKIYAIFIGQGRSGVRTGACSGQSGAFQRQMREMTRLRDQRGGSLTRGDKS